MPATGGNLRDVAASLKAEADRTGRDDAAPMVLTSDGSPLAMALCASDSGYRMDAETENFVVAETVRSHPRPGSNSLGNMIAGALRIEAGKRDALARAMGVRRLTPRECERLMGWPDDWTRYTADGREIPDSHRYRMCGNGVVSTVAEWIGRRLVMADRFMREDVA